MPFVLFVAGALFGFGVALVLAIIGIMSELQRKPMQFIDTTAKVA